MAYITAELLVSLLCLHLVFRSVSYPSNQRAGQVAVPSTSVFLLYSPSQTRWRAQIFRSLQDSHQPATSAGTTAVSKSEQKPIKIVRKYGPMWIVQKFCKVKLVWWSKIWFVVNLWLPKTTIINVSGILRLVFRLLETSCFDNYFNL
jgi:hypothetical protein